MIAGSKLNPAYYLIIKQELPNCYLLKKEYLLKNSQI